MRLAIHYSISTIFLSFSLLYQSRIKIRDISQMTYSYETERVYIYWNIINSLK